MGLDLWFNRGVMKERIQADIIIEDGSVSTEVQNAIAAKLLDKGFKIDWESYLGLVIKDVAKHDHFGGMVDFLESGRWDYVVKECWEDGTSVEDAAEAWEECYNDYAQAHQ